MSCTDTEFRWRGKTRIMIILRIILRVCFSVIVGFFGVVSLIAGYGLVSAEKKLFPSGLIPVRRPDVAPQHDFDCARKDPLQ